MEYPFPKHFWNFLMFFCCKSFPGISNSTLFPEKKNSPGPKIPGNLRMENPIPRNHNRGPHRQPGIESRCSCQSVTWDDGTPTTGTTEGWPIGGYLDLRLARKGKGEGKPPKKNVQQISSICSCSPPFFEVKNMSFCGDIVWGYGIKMKIKVFFSIFLFVSIKRHSAIMMMTTEKIWIENSCVSFGESALKQGSLWVVPLPRLLVTTRIISCLGSGIPINLHLPLLLGRGQPKVAMIGQTSRNFCPQNGDWPTVKRRDQTVKRRDPTVKRRDQGWFGKISLILFCHMKRCHTCHETRGLLKKHFSIGSKDSKFWILCKRYCKISGYVSGLHSYAKA